MSTTKEQVLQYMLKLIAANDGKLVAKTLDAFDGIVSKSTVYNYLSELCENDIIKKNGSSYELITKEYLFEYENDRLFIDTLIIFFFSYSLIYFIIIEFLKQ